MENILTARNLSKGFYWTVKGNTTKIGLTTEMNLFSLLSMCKQTKNILEVLFTNMRAKLNKIPVLRPKLGDLFRKTKLYSF